jgi:WD40 repeat protein
MTWANDNRVRIWDGATGAEVLSPVAGYVIEAAWSPAGDRFVAAGVDGMIRIWDLSPALLTLHGMEGMPCCAMSWSPEGDRIAHGFPDGTIKIWDVSVSSPTYGEEVLSFVAHTMVAGINWCPDGDRIATSGEDGTLRVWDAKTGERLATLGGHWDSVYALEWSPDGTRILSAGFHDYSVMVWDATTGNRLLAFTGHDNWIYVGGAAWSPDGRTIATASYDGTAKVWDAATGEVIRELFPEDSKLPVTGLGWSPDGRHIATSTGDGIGQVWDAQTGEQLVSLAGPPATAVEIDWANTGDRILITYIASGVASVWDLSAALGSNQSTVLDLDSAAGPDGDTVSGFELVRYDVGRASTAFWSPDGNRVAMAGLDGALRVFPAWQTTQELIEYARECCVVRELTDAEREQFGLPAR